MASTSSKTSSGTASSAASTVFNASITRASSPLDAIRRNGAYKGNPTLNRNIIRMLASVKTRAKATAFLRSTIGAPSAPYLRAAAQHEPNPVVRKYAAALAKQIR